MVTSNQFASARARRWMASVTVLLGTIALGFSATMVMVALPAMMKAFDVNQDMIQWMATGFQITATTSILATGWLTGRFGLRAVYIAALLIFTIASLLGAYSDIASVAIAARVLQGVAMGLVPAVALITIAQVFPAHAVGLAMGVFGVGAVLAPAIGPAVAGVLLAPYDWPVIFLFPLLFSIPALLLAVRYIPDVSRAAVQKPFDWLGMLLLTIFIIALLNVTGLGLNSGWTHWLTLACLGLSLLSLLCLVVWQLRCAAPLLELELLRDSRFRQVLGVALVYGFCLYGTSYLIPYFLQSGAGYTPADSGAVQVPGGVIVVLVIFVAGALCDRVGARRVTQAGIALFALSSLGFTFLMPGAGFWQVAAWFALSRIAMGMLIPSTSVAAIQSVTPQLLPYASTTMNFALQLGGAIGINVFAIFYQWRLGTHEEPVAGAVAAFHECFWLAVGLMVLALLPATRISKSPATEGYNAANTKVSSCP